MKNFRKITLSIALIVQLLIPIGISQASSFSDLVISHKDYESIQFLAENGIISGYPDGTVRPNQKVNRVEFLKIVIESTGIVPKETAATNFSDVDESAWYGPYLRTAKANGWVSGFPDNTFKPAQTINTVEALKIIAEVQEWNIKQANEILENPYEDTPKGAWYASYVEFAKAHSITQNTENLLPGRLLTRGDVASMLHNTIKQHIVAFTPKPELLNTPEEEPVIEELPSDTPTIQSSNFKLISEGSFHQIALDEKFPNTFYQNEIYLFEGVSENTNEEEVLIFLGDNRTENYENFIGYTDAQNHFSIPVVFRKTGEFKIGIIPGTSGNSKVFTINVLDSLPNSSNKVSSKAPSNLSINFDNNSTKIQWSKNSNNIFKATFWQDNQSVTYFTRQNLNSIPIVYRDFASFKEGEVNYTINGAVANQTKPINIISDWQQGETKTFQATSHENSTIDNSAISINNSFPSKFSAPARISFSGILKVNSAANAAIIKPNGFIEKVSLISSSPTIKYFNSDVLPANAQYTFSYTPKTLGTYIVEINKENGAASLNSAIYIGNGIPLLPDYFDLNSEQISLTPIKDYDAARNEILILINQARTEHGLKTVKLDAALNKIAQAHSEDMIRNNYFSHINLDGQSPSDRRKEAGINTEIGENLGKAPSILYGHEGLMRSAIHRENILDAAWTKVGIGVEKDSAGFYYITQEFSHNEYTQNDLEVFEAQTFKAINDKRSEIGLVSIAKNESLDTITQALSLDLKNRISITAERLSTLFEEAGINKNAFVLSGNSPNNLKIIEEATRKIDSTHSKWINIGIDYNLDEFGTLLFVILYAN